MNKSRFTSKNTSLLLCKPLLVLTFILLNILSGVCHATVVVGGVSAQTEDIIVFDSTTANYSTFFDGSDYGLAGVKIDAFHVVSADEVLISIEESALIPGLGFMSPQDIFSFTLSSGVSSMIFDGSDVGLGFNENGNIDAISLDGSGNLIISTAGDIYAVGVGAASSNDLLKFTASTLGVSTSGVFETFLDGSVVGLARESENIDALFVDPTFDSIYMSTAGDFSVGGLSGSGADIFICNNPSTCSSASLFSDIDVNTKTKGFSLLGNLSFVALQRLPIPEPMSLWLMLIGLASLLCKSRTRQNS